MTQPLHLSRFCFWWCWERVSRQHEAETSGSAQRPESVRQKAQSGYGCGKPDDLQQAWHGRQVSLPEGVGDFYSWNIRWFWFFDPYVLLWHLPQSIQDLSSCPFPGLYCSFHVTAPLCGSLCASKVNSAYRLANHPSREQRGHAVTWELAEGKWANRGPHLKPHRRQGNSNCFQNSHATQPKVKGSSLFSGSAPKDLSFQAREKSGCEIINC